MQNEVFTRRECTILKRLPNSIFPMKEKIDKFKSYKDIFKDNENSEISEENKVKPWIKDI